MSKKVILDTDPGIDDAMAIIFAHEHKDIDLIGITTVFGNATIETTTNNALHLKRKFGLSTDIAMGASSPLKIIARDPAAIVHGNNGLGDIDIPKEDFGTLNHHNAHDYIIEQIHANPHEITLIAVGPLTNLALAVQKDPSITGLVKEVIIMGGAFGHHGHTGNVSPFAEANIIDDPHAADIVFTSPWPVTVVGLDVTKLSIMNGEYIAKIAQSSVKYGEFLGKITPFYADFHKKAFDMDGFHVHDYSALAYAVDPTLFTTKRGNIRVVTEGPAMGHTMFKDNPRVFPVDEWSNQPKQNICVEVKSQELLDLYFQTITD